MLTILKWGAAVVVLGALGAIAFAWSGIFNVAASRGHWPIAAWFLHFTMQNSVQTHAFSIETPGNLSDPGLIARGAGHYHLGCATCHGAPGISRNAVVKKMVPPPPYLVQHVADWKPRELFWIVKHGIKYAGMPAWPSHERDDEVWAVTAFLLKLPEIDAERYIELATGAPAADGSGGALTSLSGASPNPITTCAQCHGLDGLGRDGDAFPKLSGQKEEYLRATLEDFASGKRNSGIMQPIAHTLTKSQIETLAAHYAAFEWQAAEPSSEPGAGDLELGRKLAVHGMPSESIPACQSCHGEAADDEAAGGTGADRSARPHFPRLAGQHESYIRQQLELFRSKERGGRRAPLMRGTAERMTDEQIAAVAAYYASLAVPGQDSKAVLSAPPSAE